MSQGDVIRQVAFLEVGIPYWQMALYIAIISLCVLTYRRKLSLIVTYLFTLYWSFFVYWGDFFASFGHVPSAAALFILFGTVHVVFTLVAFFQPE